MRRLALATIVAVITACASAASPPPSPTPTVPVTLSVRTVTLTPAPTAAGSPTEQVFSGTASVDIGDQFFLPQTIIVTVGTTVTWTNRGQSGHSATSRDGTFGSSTLDFGGTYKFTFTRPGRYPYFCMTHNDMTGEVVVR